MPSSSDLNDHMFADNYMSTSNLSAPVENGWNGLASDRDVVVAFSYMLGVVLQVATEADGSGAFWYWRYKRLNGTEPWTSWGKLTGPPPMPHEPPETKPIIIPELLNQHL